jgi:PhnB protein
MAKIKLNPYIFFKGNCHEAMEFYKNALGGTVEYQTYEDVGQAAEGLEGKIMHSKLENDDLVIFGSDTTKASDTSAKVSLSLMGTDEARLRKVFADLSKGGDINSELKTEFWGDTFGSFTDKYGVEWMMNIAANQDAAK